MLSKETVELLKGRIKTINKLKTVEERIAALIQLREETHNAINDELDDVFSAVNLKKSRINLEEED